MYMYTEGSGRGFSKNEYGATAANQVIMRVSVRTSGYQTAGGGIMFSRRSYKSYTVQSRPGIHAWFYGGAETSRIDEISDPGGIFSGGWGGAVQYFTNRDAHSYYRDFSFNGGGVTNDYIQGEYYHQRAFVGSHYTAYTWDASNGGAGDGSEATGAESQWVGF